MAVVQARKGLDVCLWARSEEEASQLNRSRENTSVIPSIPLPDNLHITHSIEEALRDTTATLWAVPSQSMRANVELARDYLDRPMLLISAAKGLETHSNLRMSQVIAEVLDVPSTDICVLSGPNLSREIVLELPAASVVASGRSSLAKEAQELFTAPDFYVLTSDDVVGVEMGGSLKNIIALGAGVTDGLGLGDNAKAILITEGWAEITALGVAMGARPDTFSGLAGLGDLVATCASPLSRNHYFGEQLARGRSLDEIADSTPHVAEGVPTTRVACELARELRVEMPIAGLIYGLLFEGTAPWQAAKNLMHIVARNSKKTA